MANGDAFLEYARGLDSISCIVGGAMPTMSVDVALLLHL